MLLKVQLINLVICENNQRSIFGTRFIPFSFNVDGDVNESYSNKTSKPSGLFFETWKNI